MLGLALIFFLGWPAGPPEQISRWPNGSFGGPDAVNVLMSTCTVNPSARIYLSPQICWVACLGTDPVFQVNWRRI